MTTVGRTFVFVLFVCVLAVPICRAAAEPSKPFSKVPLDLNSGGIEETLPFDIPFYFSGTADADVRRFDLELVKAAASGVSGCPAGPAIAKGSWQRRDAAVSAFTVFEREPLDANQMYCLHLTVVRSVATTVMDKFRQDASQRIDYFLRGEPKGNVDIERGERVRQELIELLKDPITGDMPRVQAGSILAPLSTVAAADQPALKKRFAAFFTAIKQAQDVRSDEIANFSTIVSNVTRLLEKWGGPDGAYQKLLTRFEEIARANATFEAILSTRRPAVKQLLALTGSSLTRAIDGATDSAAAAALKDVWDPADFDARAKVVQATLDRITAAHGILTDALDTAHVGALSATEQANARALVPQLVETEALVKLGVIGSLTTMKEAAQNRRQALASVLAQLENEVIQNVSLVATTVGNFATRHAWYIGADLGFAVVPGIEATTPYIGTNIYFRPVNKNAPLQGKTDSFSRRASAMVGITVGSDLTKVGQRVDLFGSRMLLTGGGMRINDSLRVAGGTLWFKAPDPNPFVDNTKINFAWFLSFSVDWDVKDTFTSMTTKQP